MYISNIHDANDLFLKSNIPNIRISDKPMSDMQLYFAYFSLYILFPLLYIILVSGDQSAIMTLWRYIKSGIFDSVSHIKEFLTDFLYGALRTFGQYSFSTYTVVKNGREIFTASSMYFYRKSDIKSVYRIDRAKYAVCKWIDKQCQLYRYNHHEDPEINETHNAIYDFILHKVDNQPYTRIHRGDFTGRTHTLITEHYRPFPKSFQIADNAELIVYTNSTTVEPALHSSYAGDGGADAEIEPCFRPQTFNINLKSPHNFFLEKNEILDSKFLQWKLYNEFGKSDLANRLCSLFYNYKVIIYNECINENLKPNTVPVPVPVPVPAPVPVPVPVPVPASDSEEATEAPTRVPLYNLNDQQTVIVGNRYIIKVDSILRCPVIESGEKSVFDIDGILSNYYDCSDSDSDSSCVSDESDSSCDSDTDNDTDHEIANETKMDYDDPEFELIQDPSE